MPAEHGESAAGSRSKAPQKDSGGYQARGWARRRTWVAEKTKEDRVHLGGRRGGPEGASGQPGAGRVVPSRSRGPDDRVSRGCGSSPHRASTVAKACGPHRLH